MKARLLKLWLGVRASYWFIPSLMALAAVALALVLPVVDVGVGAAWIYNFDLLYANQPDGARALLSTIAGSMITVAGVTFSITIAAVAYATSQFGPRLLSNFMEDEGNQLTLGTFIATFLYCVLVLRTIRDAAETPPPGIADGAPVLNAFVPHISILFGLFLALASIGVLIYFIHHVPESIHASNVVAHVARELHAKIDHLFPAMIGRDAAEPEAPAELPVELPADFLARAAAVPATGSGYIQYIDQERLLVLARRHDLIVRVEYRPGDFVVPGRPLVYAWPAARLDAAATAKLQKAFAWGRRRTPAQDAAFLVDELVEIAARALSPGVNDPFTAINCMNWLGSALAVLGGRPAPSAGRYDDEGRLRVVARPLTFQDLVDNGFDQLRPYAARDRNAALHLMKIVGEVGSGLADAQQRALLAEHATALKAAAEEALTQRRDLEPLLHRYHVVLRLLRDPSARAAILDAEPWLAGSA